MTVLGGSAASRGVPSSSGAGAEVLQVQRALPRVPRGQRPPFTLGTLCPHSMALAPAGAPICWGSWANTAVSCDHHFCPSVSQRGVTGSGPQSQGEELAAPSREECQSMYGAILKQPRGVGKWADICMTVKLGLRLTPDPRINSRGVKNLNAGIKPASTREIGSRFLPAWS